MKPLLRIAITGSAGQLAYSLLFRLASGEVFGRDQPLALHLLELPEALKALEGVKMELEDGAFPCLREILWGDDPHQVFKEIDWALLLGAKPRTPGMERKDLLAENVKIFVQQGRALDQVAKKTVRVLVVGNPCNTNALVAMKNAPTISKKNFFGMTRLDQNRASALLGQQARVPVSDVKNVVIWGNHSSTQVPDFYHAEISGLKATEVIKDLSWLKGDFVNRVQKRGAEILMARGKSSAASAASAIIDAMLALLHPTPEGQWFSSAVYSEGNPYGVEGNLMFSFPCRSLGNGEWDLVRDLALNDWLKDKIAVSQKELIEERELAL